MTTMYLVYFLESTVWFITGYLICRAQTELRFCRNCDRYYIFHRKFFSKRPIYCHQCLVCKKLLNSLQNNTSYGKGEFVSAYPESLGTNVSVLADQQPKTNNQ